MLKMKNKIIDGLLAFVLVLGLGGCTFNDNVATHKTNSEPTNAKVAKQSTSHSKANKNSQTNSSSESAISESSSSEQANITTNSSVQNSQVQAASSVAAMDEYADSATTQNSSVAASSQQEQNSSPVINESNGTSQTSSIQLGQTDLAVWTDQYGIVHHVDVNGLDYQTIPGSSQVHYEEWTGQLPANAQIIHNAGPNVPEQSDKYQQSVQLGLGDVAVWTDQYGIIHHVDCDGMDRQTIPGSTQVHYEDWYGALPDNAQIIHND